MSKKARRAKQVGDDLSGRQLGDYRLLRRLGRGAMAEVYLAEQRSLSRQVAVKVLKSDLASDETYVRRFQREAQAAASLVHANIVQIHEVGRIDRVYFIAQEYIQGVNLRQWMARNGTLDLRLALLIMRQVAAALAKAAEQGIVHRDIKPENIMLTRSGEVKVTDFGLARLLQLGDKTDLTQVGMTMGTPLYMSPEQAEGKSLDHRSDIYSLGVTCYHMLTGSPPFEGATALSVAVQHLKKKPELLENLRPDLPPALARIVHKMLAKDPDSRYQSPRELLRELRPLQLEYLRDEEWPEDLPGLETAEADLAGTLRNETAERLGSLMKTASLIQANRFFRIRWAAGTVAVFLLGGTMAFLTTVEAPLLSEAESRPLGVPLHETAFSHWMYASYQNTEEAWQSLIRSFPQEASLVQRARQQLARVYLRDGRNDEAMAIFKEFASMGGPDEELRAFGLAGQFGVLTVEGKYAEATGVLDKLWPIRSKLESPDMWQLVRQAVQRYRSMLGERSSQQWQEWLDEQFPETVDTTDAP